MKRTILGLLALALSVPLAHGQAVSLGADLMSRYIWRGYDFGESFSVQPALEFSSGGFAVGSWAAYSISADGSGANEHDLYVSYTAGPLSFGVTDYYFPAPGGAAFFDYDAYDDGPDGVAGTDDDIAGGHWIEPFVSYSGPAAFPISLYAAAFVHNDPDRSVYLQADYPFAIDGVDLSLTLGAVPMASAFYGTSGPALVNVGLSATRSVPITDTFALPVSVAYILNPDAERTYLVFGISF